MVAGVTYLNFNGCGVQFLQWSFTLPYAVYLLLIVILIWASINVVNCTDGVDGLSASLAVVTIGTYLIAYHEELGDYDKTHKILILTTQVTYEGSDVGIYEVGKRVKNRFRFLEAHDMTIEAVVTKSMWLLAQNCDSFDQLQQRFYRQVNFDTFYH